MSKTEYDYENWSFERILEKRESLNSQIDTLRSAIRRIRWHYYFVLMVIFFAICFLLPSKNAATLLSNLPYFLIATFTSVGTTTARYLRLDSALKVLLLRRVLLRDQSQALEEAKVEIGS